MPDILQSCQKILMDEFSKNPPGKVKFLKNAELVFQDLPIRVKQSRISYVILKSVFVNSYVCSYGHCQQGHAKKSTK